MRKKQVIPVKAEKLNSYYEENRGLERGCISNEIANPSLKSEIKNIKSLFKLFMITGIVAFLQMSTLTVAKGEDILKYIDALGILITNHESLARAQKNLAQKQLEKTTAYLEKTKEIHKSITGNRIRNDKSADNYMRKVLLPPAEIKNYLLEEYDIPDRRTAEIEEILTKNGLNKNLLPNNRYKDDREEVLKKLQNTMAFGGYLNENSVFMANNRFEALKKLTEKVENTEDLKGIGELQVTINLLAGIIQNEAIKLQIAKHSFKNRKALINQRKHQLYTAVFNHKNTGMPSIKSVSTKF